MKIDMQDKNNHTIGIISDTHGLLRPGAVNVFQGVDLIIHAGDIGAPSLLRELGNTARLVAVRGNMDYGNRPNKLPVTEVVTINDNSIYVLHDINRLDLDPAVSGISVVISGHTHKSSIKKRGGVLYVNPGSAGPRRFRLPASVALLYITGSSLSAKLIEL